MTTIEQFQEEHTVISSKEMMRIIKEFRAGNLKGYFHAQNSVKLIKEKADWNKIPVWIRNKTVIFGISKN